MTWNEVLAAHRARYPQMEPQDYGKLAYQSCFGPEHMISGPEQAEEGIVREREALEVCSAPAAPEEIGGGLCRFPLSSLKDEGDAVLLARLFAATAREHQKAEAEFGERLEQLKTLGVPGMAEWLGAYQAAGCPPVRHSQRFRRAYRPHYRLIKWEYARYFGALREVMECLGEKRPVILAIDGRCGSGKSSLGRILQEVFSCALIHMDDYYLPVDRRGADWMEVPAGNMDLERLREEVLEPARRGETVHSRPYCCQTGTMGEEGLLSGYSMLVVEGSYSQHPSLRGYYDRTIFLTCGKQEQIRRLRQREGDYFPRFQQLWMPLEEKYFRAFAIQERADLTLDSGRAAAENLIDFLSEVCSRG